jgi:ubiquinone/menaquinone biosynthesis C-methylase UbiE
VSTGQDPFAVIAEFYDLDLEGYGDDLELYRELAASEGGPVLELGCGTGRVAAALAAKGVEVVAVDLSPSMLRRARARLEQDGLSARVELIEGDMRDLRLDRRFPLVLVPLGGIQHMETTDDVVGVLEVVARHLDAGGRALLDLEAPLPDDFTPGPQPLVEHWTRELDGSRVTKTVAVEARPALGLREVTWHFDLQATEGGLRRYTERFTLKVITLGELEMAARLAGLEVSGTFGDYDWSPYDDGAERLVVTLEAPAR